MPSSSETGGADVAPPPAEALEARIGALPGLSIADLRQAWAAAWGAPPPKGARRRLLMLGIAWKWQAELHGGFSRSAERRLALLEAAFRQSGAPKPEWAPTVAEAAPARQPADPGLEGGAARGRGHRDRLSVARPELGLALLGRPRDHRHPPQRARLLRPARRGRAVTPSPRGRAAARSIPASPATRGWSRRSTRSTRSARLASLHPEPEARGLDHPDRLIRRRRLLRRLDGPPRPSPVAGRCRGRQASMSWSSTRSTG